MIFLLVCLGALYVVGGVLVLPLIVLWAAAVPQMYPWTANWPSGLIGLMALVSALLWPLTLLLIVGQSLVGWVWKRFNPDPPPDPNPGPPVI